MTPTIGPHRPGVLGYLGTHSDEVGVKPAQYARRPKVYPSEGHGLDRGELDRFLFTAERYDPHHAALAALLGLNGLRVSEACATDAEDLGFDRGHRTLRIIGKGNNPAVIPLVPRVARTIDLALGERCEGPILHRHDGQRLDRRTAHRWVRSIGKRAGLGSSILICSVPRSSSRHSMQGSRCATSRSQRATPIRGRRPSMIAGARTSTAMPHMSWWPSWQEGRARLRSQLTESGSSPRRLARTLATSSTDRSVRSAATRT